jgi:hypothetical protein
MQIFSKFSLKYLFLWSNASYHTKRKYLFFVGFLIPFFALTKCLFYGVKNVKKAFFYSVQVCNLCKLIKFLFYSVKFVQIDKVSFLWCATCVSCVICKKVIKVFVRAINVSAVLAVAYKVSNKYFGGLVACGVVI